MRYIVVKRRIWAADQTVWDVVPADNREVIIDSFDYREDAMLYASRLNTAVKEAIRQP